MFSNNSRAFSPRALLAAAFIGLTLFGCPLLLAAAQLPEKQISVPRSVEEVPVRNWQTNPNWRPRSSGIEAALTAGLVGAPVVFQGFGPCRLVDTRGSTGTYGGPALSASTTRTFPLQGTAGYACTSSTP